ncbi:hypothetical protein AMTRI_Chr07g74700 [Amborella trichopoda]
MDSLFTKFSIFFFLFSLLPLAISQDDPMPERSHGLANERPMQLSPQAVGFFNPEKRATPIQSASPPHYLPSKPRATAIEEDGRVQTRHGIGAAGVAGIVFSFVFAVLLAIGAYYVVVTRRANTSRAITVTPDLA